MSASEKEHEFIIDIITGEQVPLVGAEENRQAVIHALISQKGYAREDLKRDVPICVPIGTEQYCSKIDLLVCVRGRTVMVIKCAAGSLGSREREALAAARLLEPHPIPLTMVSDGVTAAVLNTETGKVIATGWEGVPTREDAENHWAAVELAQLPPPSKQKESLIFRSYDSMNVNIV